MLVLGILVSCRPAFYRKASLLAGPFTPGWMAAVAAVLAATLWLGFFSYRHVEYANDLWWTFELRGGAPRFLRASAGVFGLVLVLGLVKLLRPAPPPPRHPGPGEVERVREIVRGSPETIANLALADDKSFLLSSGGDAFLMYAVQGRSCISMGDPVGPPGEWPELAWRFRDLCDRYGGHPVFYEVRAESLPLYLDLDLTPLKLGEEARVPLAGFSLEGGGRKSLRRAVRRAEKEGCTFEIVPSEGVPELLPDLRRVSDEWLAERGAGEKRFSLGCFDERYLRQFPAALVRRGGRIVAFANLWLGAERAELSPDLMRHLPGAPEGTMEYLFVELMRWGAAQGYGWFNLGMAPLSGMEGHAYRPRWYRWSALVYRRGSHFYNFQGLRRFKEKFDPVWEPRYLVSPGGLARMRVLADVMALVGGGVRRTLSGPRPSGLHPQEG